jgi:DNA repair protein RadC
LDKRLYLLGVYNVCKGSMNTTTSDHFLIYAAALKSAAGWIKLVHNRPGGNPKPSDSDMKLIAEIKEGAALLRIKLMDLILS